MDVITNIRKVPLPGESSLGTSLSFIPGGKGANQAVALSRLGADVSFYGKVGKDAFGFEILNHLNEEKLDTSKIFLEEDISTGVALIIVEENGENRIIVIAGANMNFTEEDIKKLEEEVAMSDIVLIQLEIPIHVIRRIISKAVQCNIPIVVDAGPAQKIPLDVFNGVNILSPNETEAYALTGIEVKDIECGKKACEKLFQSGVKIVVLKMGNKGALIYDETGLRHCPAYKIKAVDTTAAGDGFTAALTLNYVEGTSIDECVKFANAVGALTATKYGSQASLPYLWEVENFISSR